jgi:hypothetical protein
MFKKAVEARSHQRLSGADRKKLKRTVKERFPRASDADIDTLLPPKVSSFSLSISYVLLMLGIGIVFVNEFGCKFVIFLNI